MKIRWKVREAGSCRWQKSSLLTGLGHGTWPRSGCDTGPQAMEDQWVPWPGRAHWWHSSSKAQNQEPHLRAASRASGDDLCCWGFNTSGSGLPKLWVLVFWFWFCFSFENRNKLFIFFYLVQQTWEDARMASLCEEQTKSNPWWMPSLPTLLWHRVGQSEDACSSWAPGCCETMREALVSQSSGRTPPAIKYSWFGSSTR